MGVSMSRRSNQSEIEEREGRDELFRRALEGGFHSGKGPITDRSYRIEQDCCFFCGRSEEASSNLQKLIISKIDSRIKRSSKKSGAHDQKIRDSISSFEKLWSTVNKKLKLGAVCSDPESFLPEEISQYFDEEWYESTENISNWINRSFRGLPISEESHDEWFSLEYLCLRWMITHHRKYELGGYGKFEWVKRNGRINELEEQMMEEIVAEFRENFERPDSKDEWNQYGDYSQEDLLYVEKRMNESLKTLFLEQQPLQDFVWKPFTEDQISSIKDEVKEDDDDDWGSSNDGSGPRSGKLSVLLKICPICKDRFQVSDSDW